MSGGGIDALQRAVKLINSPCAGRARVDAMVTGRMAPIILLEEWSDFLWFAGRRNARRALDCNPFM